MRQWLWVDTLQNVKWFSSDYFVLHMLLSTVLIFAVCILLDRLRIVLVEKPLMQSCDGIIKRLAAKIAASKY